MQELKEKDGIRGAINFNMNKEELKNNFDFEKKKHIEFYLPFYEQKNWLLVQDNIDSNQKNDWDVKLEVFAGQYKTIDEKALREEHDNFLTEIIQDMKTGNLGWLFGEKDWILYGSWNNKENIEPSSLYLIRSGELKNYICNLEGFIKTCISKKGWGITWNLVLNWKDLIEKNIAEKLI